MTTDTEVVVSLIRLITSSPIEGLRGVWVHIKEPLRQEGPIRDVEASLRFLRPPEGRSSLIETPTNERGQEIEAERSVSTYE